MVLAIALHVVAALFAPHLDRTRPHLAVVSERVTVAFRTPRPTPPPTPPPTPKPLVTPRPRATLAPRVSVRAPAPQAAATPHLRSGGAAAPKHVAHAKPKSQRPTPPVALADGTKAGVQNGGAGTGAGAGTGDSGLAGAGTGSDTAGAGNGGDLDTSPCGDVYILPAATAFRKDGTVLQNVLAKIILRDGSVEVDRFPYPFVYAGEKADPFKHEAALASDGGVPVQQPPPNSDVTKFPVAVQIVLKYTDPKTGLTSLPACSPVTTTPRPASG